MAIKIASSQLRGLPSTSGVQTPGVDAFGAGVGKATQQLANVIGTETVKFQETENLNKTRDADTFYQKRINEIKTGYQALTGKEKYDSLADYNQSIEEAKKEALNQLDNHVQRDMISNVMERRESDAKMFGGLHAAEGLKKWEIEALESQVTMHTEDATRNYGTPQGKESLQRTMENLEDMGERIGLPPEKVVEMQVKAQSQIIADTIKSRADKDPWGAQQLLKTDGDKMLQADRVAVEGIVKGHTDKARAFATADGLIAKYGGPDSPELNAALRDVDPDIRTMVRTEIDFQSARAERIKRKAEKDNEDATWKNIYSNPNATTQNLPPPGAVSSSAYAAMQSYLVRREQNGGIDVDDRDVITELNAQMSGTADKVQEFASRDLTPLRAVLKPDTWQKYKDVQDQIKTGLQTVDPKSQAFMSDAKLHTNALALAGIKDKPKDEARFSFGLTAALGEEAARLKRSLTDTEKQAVVARHVYMYKTSVVTEDRDYWFDATDKLSNQSFSTSDGTQWPHELVYAVSKTLEAEGKELSTKNIQERLDMMEQKAATTK